MDDSSIILNDTAHRPYPLPAGRPIMSQRWNDLLFAHWPIAPERVAPTLPPGLELDTFDGAAWLGVVPFTMDRVRNRIPLLLGTPTVAVPSASQFAELNLRTYVRSKQTGKRGVFFYALECASPVAVAGARVLFHLPYFLAAMTTIRVGESLSYRSRRLLTRQSVHVELTYRPTGPVAPPARPGTLAHFLTERYCLFTPFAGKLLRGDIHHEPWPLQPAEAEFRTNELPHAHGFHLPEIAPVLHFSRELQVFLWPLTSERQSTR